MIHSLEQRYVKLRDEHSAVKSQRDELLASQAVVEERLAEEQRQKTAVGLPLSPTLCACPLPPPRLPPAPCEFSAAAH